MAKDFHENDVAAGYFRWKPAAWLSVTGDDAYTFLQGQFTNDLRPLLDSKTPASYGLWLNHKGRVLADSFVVKGAEGYFVGSYFSPAAVIRERLEAFIIADDVTVEDQTAAWTGLTVFGESAELPAAAAGWGAFAFPGRRSEQPHLELVGPNAGEDAVLNQLESRPCRSTGEMERIRIRDGIAAVPFDLGPGELPNEGGLETVAISYTKGCYLGQEVIARLKSMGQVRRRLLRMRGTGRPPSLPQALHQGDRRIGELRTAAIVDDGYIGFALLTLLHLDRSTGLSFSAGEAPSVEVVDPS